MNIKMAKNLTTPPDLSSQITHCSTFILSINRDYPHFKCLGEARFVPGGMQEKFKCLLDDRVYVVTIKPETL
jgi:hypothetical protein